MVYFVRDGLFVKIGFSKDVDGVRKRIDGFRVGNPRPIRLLWIMDGTLEREQQLHAVFSTQRAGGEWFHLRGALLSFLAGALRSKANTFDIKGDVAIAVRSKHRQVLWERRDYKELETRRSRLYAELKSVEQRIRRITDEYHMDADEERWKNSARRLETGSSARLVTSVAVPVVGPDQGRVTAEPVRWKPKCNTEWARS